MSSTEDYDPASQFTLTTEYDAENETPRAVLSLKPSLRSADRIVDLQEIGLELRLGSTVLQSQSILVDLAEDEFVDLFKEDRLTSAGATLERALDAATPTNDNPLVAFEVLLDVETFEARRRSGEADALEAIAYYDAFRLALVASQDLQDNAESEADFEQGLQDGEALASAGLLLTGRLRQDAASQDINLSAAASAATDSLQQHGGTFYTIFSGLGQTTEIARKESYGGAGVFVLAIVEEPVYLASDTLRIELGSERGMVQAYIESGFASPFVSSQLIADIGAATQDTYVTLGSVMTQGDSTEIYSYRFGGAETHPLFSVDLAGVGGVFPNSAEVALTGTPIAGFDNGQRIEAHQDFWTPTLWDEDTLIWDTYQATLNNGFRQLDGSNEQIVTAPGQVLFDVTEAAQRALLAGDSNADGILDANGGLQRGDLEAAYLAASDPDAYREIYGGLLNLVDDAVDGGKDFLYRNDLDWDGDVDGRDVYWASRRLDALGDFNLDGITDGQDYSIWQANYGSQAARYREGDANADGLVDAADYTAWRDGENSEGSNNPYNGNAEPSELTFRIVPTTDGLVTYAAPSQDAGFSIDITATSAAQVESFVSQPGDLGWTVDYRVLNEDGPDVTVAIYQIPLTDGPLNQETLVYESAVQSGSLGNHRLSIDSAEIAALSTNSEYRLAARLISGGTVTSARDFAGGAFFDQADALHFYGDENENLALVSSAGFAWSRNTEDPAALETAQFGGTVPVPTSIFAQLGKAEDTFSLETDLGVSAMVHGGRGDDHYLLLGSPSDDLELKLGDSGGFDTLTLGDWANGLATDSNKTIDLQDPLPQNFVHASSTHQIAIDFVQGGEIQFVEVPGEVDIVGPGYNPGPLIVDSLGHGFDGLLGLGELELREAIELANRIPGKQTIRFEDRLFFGGPETLLVGDDPRRPGTHHPLELLDEIAITGPGPDLLTLDAEFGSQIFYVSAGVYAELRGLTGTRGVATKSENGGAIMAVGDLLLHDTAWVDNRNLSTVRFTGGAGGAIFANSGNLTIRETLFEANYSKQVGGAIYFRPDQNQELIIERSSFIENESGRGGSALGVYSYSTNAGSVSIENSTFSGNHAPQGGVVYAVGKSSNSALAVDIVNSTIVNNHATGRFPGGVYDLTSGVMVLTNTILAENTGYQGEAYNGRGALQVSHSIVGDKVIAKDANGNYNPFLVDDESGVIVLESHETAGLKPLSNYGGSTPTHAITPESLAINAGTVALWNGDNGDPTPASDQRGGYHQRVVGDGIDIGSFESHIIRTGETTYSVYGTNRNDSISVSDAGIAIDRLPGERLDIDLAEMTAISVSALDGDDIVAVDPLFNAAMTIEGNAGSDTLYGGAASDLLLGGPGPDTLDGRGGSDILRGEGGADFLLASDDGFADTLLGQEGFDYAESDGYLDLIDLGSGQNNSFSDDKTPYVPFVGSTVWSPLDSTPDPPKIASGEELQVRYDAFDIDLAGGYDSDLEVSLELVETPPEGTILPRVQWYGGYFVIDPPQNKTDGLETWEYELKIRPRNSSTTSSSNGSSNLALAQAGSDPEEVSIPLKFEVIPELDFTLGGGGGFGHDTWIWGEDGALVVSGGGTPPFTTDHTYQADLTLSGAPNPTYETDNLPSGADFSGGVLTWDIDQDTEAGSWRTVITVKDNSFGVERTVEIVGYFSVQKLDAVDNETLAEYSYDTDYVYTDLFAIAPDGDFSELQPSYGPIYAVAYDSAIDSPSPGESLSGTFPTSVTNHFFVDSSQNEYEVVQDPQYGEVSVLGSSFTYTPGLDFSGYDEFWYEVTPYQTNHPHEGLADNASNRARVIIGGGVSSIQGTSASSDPREDDRDHAPGCSCSCACSSQPTTQVNSSSGRVSVNLPDGGKYAGPAKQPVVKVNVETSDPVSTFDSGSASQQPASATAPHSGTVQTAPSSIALGSASPRTQQFKVYGTLVPAAEAEPQDFVLLADQSVDIGPGGESRSAYLEIEKGTLPSGYYNYTASTWGNTPPEAERFGEETWLALLGNDDYGFGVGWNFAELERVIARPDDPSADKIFWIKPDGKINSFDAIGAEANQSSTGATINLLPEGGFAIVDRSKNRTEFDQDGWITRRVDAYGNALVYTYTDDSLDLHMLESAYSSLTDETTTYQSSGGRYTSVTDSRGLVTTFRYSGSKLRERTLPSDDGVAVGYSTLFDYEPDGRLRYYQDNLGTSTYTTIDYDGWAGSVSIKRGDQASTTFTGAARSSSRRIDDNSDPLDSFYTETISGGGSVEQRPGSSIDALGRPTAFTANSTGDIQRVETLGGRITEYQYNDRQQVTQEKVYLRDAAELALITVYDYDTEGRLKSITYPDDTPNSLSDNPTASFSYDQLGRVTKATDELGHSTRTSYTDFEGLPGAAKKIVTTRVIGELGGHDDAIVEQHFYPDGRLEKIIQRRNDYDGTPINSLVTVYAYAFDDKRPSGYSYGPDNLGDGLLVAATAASVTVLQWNENAFPTHLEDEQGRVTTTTYDRLGRILTVTSPDPGGGQAIPMTVYSYRKNGMLASEIQTYVGGDQVSSYSSWDGLETSYSYDSLDRLRTVATPSGLTTYSYDTAGNIDSINDVLGRKTQFGYDLAGRQTKTILPDPDNSGPLASPIIQNVYDQFDRLIGVIDPVGGITRYEHSARGIVTESRDAAAFTEVSTDEAGQVTSITDGEGRTTHRVYDDAGRLLEEWLPGRGKPTTFEYDNTGALRRQTDPLGFTTEWVYDAFGRLESEIDANQQATVYTYYPDGQLRTLTDPSLNQTTWTYDGAGRLSAETNQLNDSRSFQYDAYNRQVGQIDRLGRRIAFTFDYNEQLDAEQWYSPNGQLVRTIDYDVDQSGQLAGVTSPDASYQYFFDRLNRVTASQLRLDDVLYRVRLENDYDAAGQMTEQRALTNYQSPDFVNRYTYDILGRTTQITQSAAPGQSNVASKRIDFTYNSIGQSTAVQRFSDLLATTSVVASTFAYDDAGRLEQIAHGVPTTPNAVLHNYAWDAGDRLTSYGNSIDGVIDYRYDDRGQLLSANQLDPGSLLADELYDYDANGNRELANGSSYSTGTNNQMTFDGTYTYRYDAEGNRTDRFIDSNSNGLLDAGDSSVTNYGWDHRNRLTSVVTYATYEGPEQKRVEHRYDPFNQWIGREVTENGTTKQAAFVYDGGQIVLQYEWDGTGRAFPDDLSHRYLWGPGVDQLLADEQIDHLDNGEADGPVMWALADHLGTVRNLADSAGNVVNHRVYDSYGQLTSETDAAIESLFGYTGKALDDSTGLQNNLHRWYDSNAGRWLSEDPIDFQAGDANVSRYVENSPVGWVDLNGLERSSTSGNGTPQSTGIAAHNEFGPGKKLPTDGNKGPITDRFEECPKTATVNELKPDQRLQKPSKLRQAQRQLEKQMEAAQLNRPKKTVFGKVWAYTQDAGGNFKFAVVERYKFVRGKGGKWIAKRIPIVGTAVTLWGAYGDCKAKGLGAGAANSTLDAIPGVGTWKGVIEVIYGDDIIPDKEK